MNRFELAQELQKALFAHPRAGPIPIPASLVTLIMEELRNSPAPESPAKEQMRRLVDRFLSWPLPDSVCSDECVTKRDWGKAEGWPKRVGTNLLTADEARQMLEYVLKGDAE